MKKSIKRTYQYKKQKTIKGRRKKKTIKGRKKRTTRRKYIPFRKSSRKNIFKKKRKYVRSSLKNQTGGMRWPKFLSRETPADDKTKAALEEGWVDEDQEKLWTASREDHLPGEFSQNNQPPTSINILWIRHGFSKANALTYGIRQQGHNKLARTAWRAGEYKKYAMSRASAIANPKFSHMGIWDSPLDSLGVNESVTHGAELIQKLGGTEKIPFILCSAMKRAIETAIFMFPDNTIPIIPVPFLKETTKVDIKKIKTKIDTGIIQRDNTLSDNITRQTQNLHKRLEMARRPLLKNSTAKMRKLYVGDVVIPNDPFDVTTMQGRIIYNFVRKSGDHNKFTDNAKNGSNIDKVLEWFHSNILNIYRTAHTLPSPDDIIPIVSHSQLISAYIKSKTGKIEKMHNNEVIKTKYTSDTNQPGYKSTYVLADTDNFGCRLVKGTNHKDSAVVQSLDPCLESNEETGGVEERKSSEPDSRISDEWVEVGSDVGESGEF